MNSLRLWLTACFAGAVLVAPQTMAGGKAAKTAQTTRIDVGKDTAERIDDELSFDSPILDRRLAKPYTVRLEQGVVYDIDLRSLTLAANEQHMFLKDPAGRIVAKGRNGAGPSSRIRFSPSQTGEFQLVAAAIAPGHTGRFSLTIGPKGVPLGPQRINPDAGRSKVIGHVFDTDAKEDGKTSRSYLCDFTKGKCYRICMETLLFDPYLTLHGPAGDPLAFDDDSLGNLNAEIVWRAQKSGPHRIAAADLGGLSRSKKFADSFLLTLDEVTTLRLDHGRATSSSRLRGGDPVFSANRKNARLSPSKLVNVTVTKDRRYRIDFMSQEFDAYLYLIGPNGTVLAEDDDGGEGLNSRIEFTATASGEHRLRLCAFDGKTGVYGLRIEEVRD